MKTIICCGVLVMAFLGTVATRDAEPVINVDGKSEGRTFEGLGAECRRVVEAADGLPRTAAERDPGFSVQAELRRVAASLEGGDRWRYQLDRWDGAKLCANARKRNPRPEYYRAATSGGSCARPSDAIRDILLDVLQSGAAAWVGGGNFWSQENADFVATFILGAKRYHDVDVDFCGLWNERTHNTEWIKMLRKTLDARGLAPVKIIAADECEINTMWNIGKEVLTDRELARAIYAIGAHYPRSRSTLECVKTNKPLFASEDGPWRGDWPGACTLAKTFNRNYVVGKITKTVIWSLVSSYYDILPMPNSSAMQATEPWSGHYEVQPALWAIAHTTQFAQPGWKYLDSGCGTLKGEGSYVTLRDPGDCGDYSIIVETVDARLPQTVIFHVGGGLSQTPLHLWRTNQRSPFERLADVAIAGGAARVTLAPGSIYSFTTTMGQYRGETVVPPAAAFPMPYTDDFESYEPGKFAKYFSDQAGVFEVARRGDGRGKCLRQVVDKKGIEWQPMREPCTILGSKAWQNYSVSVDARLEAHGHVSLFGRVSGVSQNAEPLQGYRFTIAADGRWAISVGKSVLAENRVPLDPKIWHTLKLTLAGPHITASLDGTELGTVVDVTCLKGMAAIGSGWNCAEFDNFAVRPLVGNVASR